MPISNADIGGEGSADPSKPEGDASAEISIKPEESSVAPTKPEDAPLELDASMPSLPTPDVEIETEIEIAPEADLPPSHDPTTNGASEAGIKIDDVSHTRLCAVTLQIRGFG